MEALNNAKEALERRASEQLLEALSEKVNAAETLKDDYTTEEFKDVQAAIDVARALLANPEEAGSMDAVNALITLVQAISDLPEDPSFDKLREDLEETLKYVKENILNDAEGLRPGKVQELKDTVAEAEELLANPEVTADQLKSSLTKVIQKVQELWEIVNKDELNAVIASAKAIKAEGYTEESYDVLQEAIKAAEKVAVNDDATTTEVSNAITAITDAIAGLEKTDIVDKSALEYEIGLAEIIVANIDDYKPSTVEGLADKLAAAKAVFEDATATQEAVDEAAATLREARLAARVKADLTALKEAIAKAEAIDLSEYTASSAQAVKNALDNAKPLLNDPEVDQKTVDDAAKALNKAVASLVVDDGNTGGNQGGDEGNSGNQNGNESGTTDNSGNGSATDSGNTAAENTTAGFGMMALVAGGAALVLLKKKSSKQENR